MKALIINKKIVIIDIETSGLYCGEDGKEPARILKVDATKIERGKIGESFSLFVACSKYLNKNIRVITGISNKDLKGAPRIKTVLKKLKEFTYGYEVYARNSEFINKFLSYYCKKNNVTIDLPKEKGYNKISKFLNKKELIEYLKKSKNNETIALAKLLVED